MTVDPRVTLVVSCHSYGRFLDRALDTIFGQDLRELEVIVVDDASEDETAEVLRKHCADPRLSIIRHQNWYGHISSNNEGLARARGEFVGVFDADDVLLRDDAISREVAIFDANPRVGFVYPAYLLIDEEGRPFRTFQPWPKDYVRGGLEEFQHLVRSLYVPHSGTLVRRRFHDRVDVYDASLPYSADWDLWLRLCTRHDVGYIAQPLMGYRTHRLQMSQRRISPRAATDNLLRTLDNAFAALPPDVARTFKSLRLEARRRALLHQTWTDRSLGRVRRAWSGLLDAARRSPRMLATTSFHLALIRLIVLSLVGHPRYMRLVAARDHVLGGKGPVA
jgi:glycosyltransferase involved in cell wall biosynthesis